MLARNRTRMDYQRKYEEIVADYNREKDRTTIEETFRRLVELVNSLDEEQKRATKEGLREEELALFDLLQGPIGQTRSLLGEGADEGRRRSLHPGRGFFHPPDTSFYGR
jgi:type I site-specific restriction-modification system R (restriction) subunit